MLSWTKACASHMASFNKHPSSADAECNDRVSCSTNPSASRVALSTAAWDYGACSLLSRVVACSLLSWCGGWLAPWAEQARAWTIAMRPFLWLCFGRRQRTRAALLWRYRSALDTLEKDRAGAGVWLPSMGHTRTAADTQERLSRRGGVSRRRPGLARSRTVRVLGSFKMFRASAWPSASRSPNESGR